MVGITEHGFKEIEKSREHIEVEYEKAKTAYNAAKSQLKWIFSVKECDHAVEYTGLGQLGTFQCKKCKYVWYD